MNAARALQILYQFKRSPPISNFLNKKRCKSYSRPSIPTDSCGIPLQPSWSVNELLSSYPSPSLSNKTIERLYELCALIPPEEDTPQHQIVKKDLEGMIRLVEAVRLVDTTKISVRGWKDREDADKENLVLESECSGPALLRHASSTQDKFYVVHSERRR